MKTIELNKTHMQAKLFLQQKHLSDHFCHGCSDMDFEKSDHPAEFDRWPRQMHLLVTQVNAAAKHNEVAKV